MTWFRAHSLDPADPASLHLAADYMLLLSLSLRTLADCLDGDPPPPPSSSRNQPLPIKPMIPEP